MIQRRPLTKHALGDFTYFVTGANYPVGGRVGRRHTFPEVGHRPTSPRGLPPPGWSSPFKFFNFFNFNFFSHFFSVDGRLGRSPIFPGVVHRDPGPTSPGWTSPSQFCFTFFQFLSPGVWACGHLPPRSGVLLAAVLVQGGGGWASGFEGVPLMTRKKRHIYLLIIVIVAVVVLVVVWGAILPKLEGDFLTLRGHQGIAMYFRFSGEI